MSTLPAVVRNSAVLLGGTAAQKALVFVSTLVLARSLGTEGFGLYSVVFAYIAFFEMLPDSGLDQLVVREAARPRAHPGRVLGDALLLRALIGLAVLPAAAACAGWVIGDPRAPLLVILAAIPWISSFRRASLRSLLECPYRVALRMGLPVSLGVLAEAAHLAVLGWLVPRAGLPGAVGALGAAHLPFAVLFAWFAFRRTAPALRPDRAQLVALLRRARPLLGLLLANVVLARVDVPMLELLRGPREVGLYAAPVRLVEVANLLPILLMTSVYPLFARAAASDPARVDRLFRVSLRFLGVALAPVLVLQIAFAGPLVSGLFGADYAEAVPVLQALALGGLFVFADIVMTSRFVATGMDRRNLQLVLAAAIVNVLANLAVVPAHGALGAAWATVVAYVFRVLGALVFAETRSAGRAALAALLPAVVAGGASLALLARLGTSFQGVAAAALIYPAVLAALRGLRPSDVREILRALRARDR